MNSLMNLPLVAEPIICNTWQMVFNDYRLKPNSIKYYLNAETNYNLADAFGKIYVKEPYLDVFSKIKTRYSLNDFIEIMNSDENDVFIFSDCIKYKYLPNKIYNSIDDFVNKMSDIMDIVNIDSLYSFTNVKFANIKTTRNAIMCLDDVDCIINYCNDRKYNRWMYDYETQTCLYPADNKIIKSDTKQFFINSSLAWINFDVVELMMDKHVIVRIKQDLKLYKN